MSKPAPGAMELAVRRVIRSIPSGKVATYGEVAEAAGYPLYHRQVARILRGCGDSLPWHRVVGAGGQIKTVLESALDQRMRLEMEGVRFRGSRVRLAEHGFYATLRNRAQRSPAGAAEN